MHELRRLSALLHLLSSAVYHTTLVQLHLLIKLKFFDQMATVLHYGSNKTERKKQENEV